MTSIQSDRDAAKAMLEHAFRNVSVRAMLQVDFTDVVDAFADYRRTLLPVGRAADDVEASIDAVLTIVSQMRRNDLPNGEGRAALRAMLLPSTKQAVPLSEVVSLVNDIAEWSGNRDLIRSALALSLRVGGQS